MSEQSRLFGDDEEPPHYPVSGSSGRNWWEARQVAAGVEMKNAGTSPTWRHDTLRRRVQEAADYAMLDRIERSADVFVYSISTTALANLKLARDTGAKIKIPPPAALARSGDPAGSKMAAKSIQFTRPTDFMEILVWCEANV